MENRATVSLRQRASNRRVGKESYQQYFVDSLYSGGRLIAKACSVLKRVSTAAMHGAFVGAQTESLSGVCKKLSFRNVATHEVMMSDPVYRGSILFSISALEQAKELDQLQKQGKVELFEKGVEALSRQTDALSSAMEGYKKGLLDSLNMGQAYSSARESIRKRTHLGDGEGEGEGEPKAKRTKNDESQAGPSTSTSVEEEESRKTLECSICIDYFLEPVILSCGHAFCAPCVARQIQSGSEDCSQCRKPIRRITQGFRLSDIVDAYFRCNPSQVPEDFNELRVPARIVRDDLMARYSTVGHLSRVNVETGCHSNQLNEALRNLNENRSLHRAALRSSRGL